MTHETNLMTVRQFDGNEYKSSQAADQTLNAAILRAEIGRSYEEFLGIFDKFYADDVEVSSEDSPETTHGKESVRPFLLNFWCRFTYWLKLPDCRYPCSRLRFLETPPTRHIPDGKSTSLASVGNGAL